MTDPASQNESNPDPSPLDSETGAAQDAAGESAQLEQALAQKLEETRNLYMRALAELDNVRKRAQKDIEGAHRYGLEKFALELLPVKDSLELGLEAAEKAGLISEASADIKSLMAGKEATLKLLGKAFEKHGINEINPLGAPFDPQLHEAMLAQPSDTAEPNSVLKVVQKGYQLSGRLLRPARVIVSKAPDA